MAFIGALTVTTQATIEGVAGLLAGEQSVVLDFSRVDAVDEGGANAIELVLCSVRMHGGQLQLFDPSARKRFGPLAQLLASVEAMPEIGDDHAPRCQIR